MTDAPSSPPGSDTGGEHGTDPSEDDGSPSDANPVVDLATAYVADVTPPMVNMTVGQGESVELVATVRDGNGNNVGAGVPVSWGFPGSTTVGTFSSDVTYTDANGQAAVLLTATAAGFTLFEARVVGGVGVFRGDVVVCKPNPPTLANALLELTPR